MSEFGCGICKKGRARPAPIFVELCFAQSQVLASSVIQPLGVVDCVKFVLEVMFPPPTEPSPATLVAMSFGVILLFLLCFLVNQCSGHPSTTPQYTMAFRESDKIFSRRRGR